MIRKWSRLVKDIEYRTKPKYLIKFRILDVQLMIHVLARNKLQLCFLCTCCNAITSNSVQLCIVNTSVLPVSASYTEIKKTFLQWKLTQLFTVSMFYCCFDTSVNCVCAATDISQLVPVYYPSSSPASPQRTRWVSEYSDSIVWWVEDTVEYDPVHCSLYCVTESITTQLSQMNMPTYSQ